jgi:hypothetical protein
LLRNRATTKNQKDVLFASAPRLQRERDDDMSGKPRASARSFAEFKISSLERKRLLRLDR